MKRYQKIVLCSLLMPSLYAEKRTENDSTKVEELQEVIVTGQHNPQAVNKSVFEVKVISRKDIDRQAGNNLADVLNNALNLSITPNTATGKSGVSLFGLDSQYFKVLVDNVSIINEEGVGNNTDLTLINLDDVERIEIVEGAMGVQYGANEVTFNFAETFNYSKDSLYKPSPQEISGGLEWAELLEDSDNKIVIQHLLQVGTPEEPYIVKHWRQDWLYENTELYTYDADNTWKYIKKPASEVKGQWTQKVFQVDDSPRYEGSGSWVHVDGKDYWENTTDAPLPRREYTERSDYNVTVRGNRVELTDFGWVHDQDNEKVLRESDKEDVLIAKEKGYNTYVKVDDSKCQASRDWWKEHKGKWAVVRSKWDQVFDRHHDLTLKEKVSNKPMFKFLLDEEAYSDKAAIDGVIDSFVEQ